MNGQRSTAVGSVSLYTLLFTLALKQHLYVKPDRRKLFFVIPDRRDLEPGLIHPCWNYELDGPRKDQVNAKQYATGSYTPGCARLIRQVFPKLVLVL